MDFSLFQDRTFISPTADQMIAIMDRIPTCNHISDSDPYIIAHVEKLPPKPWPSMVAGRPLFITNDRFEQPMARGVMSLGPELVINTGIGREELPSQKAMIMIVEALDELGIHLKSLEWMGWCFFAYPDADGFGDSKRIYPRRVDDLAMKYIFEKEPTSAKALRRTLPDSGARDNSDYFPSLRPGVRLAHPVEEGIEILTSSGVCLQSPTGKKYITVASHGFPEGAENLAYHPGTVIANDTSSIGFVTKVFWDSDISLLELKPGLTYSREPFSSEDYVAQPFRNLKDTQNSKLRRGDNVYMDTFCNGHCVGSVVGAELLRIPAADGYPDENRMQYMYSTMEYWGNGNEALFDGCCGAPIWNDDFDVIGQYRFLHAQTSISYAPTYDRLRELGYTLSEIN
jgi:hypothetical protein